MDAVVARNLEFGLRGRVSATTSWLISSFLSRIDDDIVFQTTGGVSSNEGFFSNASDTQRIGLSTQLETGSEVLSWTLRYNWLRATFEDNFVVSSPNHPWAVNDIIPVSSGEGSPACPNTSRAWLLTDVHTRFLSPNEPRGAWLGARYGW